MRELPKELTAELLSLVLKDRLLGGERKVGDNIQLTGDLLHYEVKNCFMDKINIDTLTRLMKEWCARNSCYYLNSQISEIQDKNKTLVGRCDILDACSLPRETVEIFVADSEFEAVLEATQWVAKEKGLI